MRNTLKTIILLIAIIAGISSVLFYANTRVVLPKIPVAFNQYKYDLSQSFKILSEGEEDKKTDSIFTIVKDRIDVFELESKITIKEKDESLNEFISVYTPLFINQCLSKFNRSNWSNNNHNKMVHRVDELLALKYSDDTDLLSSTTKNSLIVIKSTVADYNQAILVSKIRAYIDINNARSIINQASMYANHQYLRNCISLKNELNTVKDRIAQSHFNQVSNEIERLNRYRYFSKEYFDNTLIPEIANVILLYENNASSLYGSNSNAENLWSAARKFQIEANSYYSKSN